MPHLTFATTGQRLLASFASLTLATWHLATLYDSSETEEVIVFEGRSGHLHVMESVEEDPFQRCRVGADQSWPKLAVLISRL